VCGGGGVRVRVRGSADARRAGVWVCLQEFRAAAQHAAALEHVASFCDNWDADEIGTVPHYLHWMRAGWNDTHTELSDVVVHVGRVLGSVRGMARELLDAVPGAAIAFIGGTGAGKTTALREVCRALSASQRVLLVDTWSTFGGCVRAAAVCPCGCPRRHSSSSSPCRARQL
jgi:hypothetical protein